MKSMILILSAFVVSTASAQGPVDVCSYKGVEVASVDEWGGMTVSTLSVAEEAKIKSAVDADNDCNEGVEVSGVAVDQDTQALQLVTVCYADSLGSKAVKLSLTCVETIQ